MNQKGFATLEVVLMVTVIGILAAVAVPRFTDVTTKANTAKIQADLSTLDSAIAIYYMEKGEYPKSKDDLKNYVQDIDSVEPPTGKVFIKGNDTAQDMPASSYTIDNTDGRAKLGTYTVTSFGK